MSTFTEQSHPEHREAQADLARQLIDTAIIIEAHRKNSGKSQNAWAREWPGLGSQKTYSKILESDLDGVSVEKKLTDYRAVLAAIAANVSATGVEPLYDDLPGSQAVLLSALRLMHHQGKDRLILVLGGSGSGKTSSLEVLASQGAAGTRLFRLEADETWKSPRAALRRMLLAVGAAEGDIKSSLAEMEDMLISRINQAGRCMLAVDEAHHVSGTVLNLFKTLLNRTELRLILAGMDTLFQKLRANASEEAKQLIHNRLFEKVRLSGPDQESAAVFFGRRLGMKPAWKASTMQTVAALAASSGHWAFLRRIVDQLRTSGIGAPSDGELLIAANAARAEVA
jgi:DNA transposition AAA+ family ATPase